MGVSKEIFGDDVFGKTSDSEQSFIEIPKEVFQGCVDELKVIFNNKEIPELGRIIEKLITEDFKLTLSGLQKTVLGISSSLLKDIELQIEGDDIYFENKTASSLKDAIMHILQNSCDHGITKSGEIKIILKELENETKITIIDNGKGIDPDLILNKAIEKGFTKREASQNFTKKEKLELILLPGFSTKETATEYSGRGVGMDVVKTNLNGLGGTLEIESTLGEGTQFSILVPKKV
jgi:two-component system chemotaxis sensor kinase CheA